MKSRADLALGRNHCSLTHSRPDTLPRGFLFCGFDSDWECGKLMRLCIITWGTLSTGYFIGNNRPVTSPFPTPSFPTRCCSCIACCRLYENDFFWWVIEFAAVPAGVGRMECHVILVYWRALLWCGPGLGQRELCDNKRRRPDSLSTIPRCWLTFGQQDITWSHRGRGGRCQSDWAIDTL